MLYGYRLSGPGIEATRVLMGLDNPLMGVHLKGMILSSWMTGGVNAVEWNIEIALVAGLVVTIRAILDVIRMSRRIQDASAVHGFVLSACAWKDTAAAIGSDIYHFRQLVQQSVHV